MVKMGNVRFGDALDKENEEWWNNLTYFVLGVVAGAGIVSIGLFPFTRKVGNL